MSGEDELERMRARLTRYMAHHGDVVIALDKLADAEAEIERLIAAVAAERERCAITGGAAADAGQDVAAAIRSQK